MPLWINIVSAWAALILSFFLIVIWALRLIYKKRKIPVIYKMNRWLRRHHKLIGILLIITGTVHGLFSSDALIGFNFGTATWVVSILLGFNWMLRYRIKKTWMTYHRILTVVFMALVVIHIVNIGGFILDDMMAGRIKPPGQQTDTEEIDVPKMDIDNATAMPTPEPTAVVPVVTPVPAPSATPEDTTQNTAPVYIDGTYTGTGTGFGPGLVVEVVIEGGKIIRVTVVDHNEQNKKFWGYAVEAIPAAIVDAQSTDVDSISGATYTSEGIKEAVDDALNDASAE